MSFCAAFDSKTKEITNISCKIIAFFHSDLRKNENMIRFEGPSISWRPWIKTNVEILLYSSAPSCSMLICLRSASTYTRWAVQTRSLRLQTKSWLLHLLMLEFHFLVHHLLSIQMRLVHHEAGRIRCSQDLVKRNQLANASWVFWKVKKYTQIRSDRFFFTHQIINNINRTIGLLQVFSCVLLDVYLHTYHPCYGCICAILVSSIQNQNIFACPFFGGGWFVQGQPLDMSRSPNHRSWIPSLHQKWRNIFFRAQGLAGCCCCKLLVHLLETVSPKKPQNNSAEQWSFCGHVRNRDLVPPVALAMLQQSQPIRSAIPVPQPVPWFSGLAGCVFSFPGGYVLQH